MFDLLVVLALFPGSIAQRAVDWHNGWCSIIASTVSSHVGLTPLPWMGGVIAALRWWSKFRDPAMMFRLCSSYVLLIQLPSS